MGVLSATVAAGAEEGQGPIRDTWPGLYIGFSSGYGIAAKSQDISFYNAGGESLVTGWALTKGGFGGGQLGYNWRLPASSLLVGLEGDIEGSDLSDSVTTKGTATGGTSVSYINRENISHFGIAKARFGYDAGPVLLYISGGAAYGEIKYRTTQTSWAGSALDLGKYAAQPGYAAGGGVEYRLNRSWALKVDYQYMDFGSASLSGQGLNSGAYRSSSIDSAVHITRAGLNFQLGSIYLPLK